jgi:uncharacterized protein YndB with AHSA1/START domain
MTPTSYSLEFEQTIDAPRAIVCRAWTDAEQLKAWYKPDDSWSTPVVEIDLRAGGRYRIGLTPPVGATFYEVGTYREVALPDRLVYTARFEGTHHQFEGAHLDQPIAAEMEKYETFITVEFQEPAPRRTRVAVTHTGYRTEEDRDRHRNGWPRFLEHLAVYCHCDAS